MLRSGACRPVLTPAPAPAKPAPPLLVVLRRTYARGAILHSFRRVDPDEVEAPRDHRLRRAAQREPERLLVALEHAMLVVEAVKVVGHADRILRDRLRPP